MAATDPCGTVICANCLRRAVILFEKAVGLHRLSLHDDGRVTTGRAVACPGSFRFLDDNMRLLDAMGLGVHNVPLPPKVPLTDAQEVELFLATLT